MAKKRGKKISKTTTSKELKESSSVIASPKKFNLVVSNLLLFLIIFLVSLGLYSVSSNEFYANLFWMVALITGFLSVALFIVYLIFLVLRYLKK